MPWANAADVPTKTNIKIKIDLSICVVPLHSDDDNPRLVTMFLDLDWEIINLLVSNGLLCHLVLDQKNSTSREPFAGIRELFSGGIVTECG